MEYAIFVLTGQGGMVEKYLKKGWKLHGCPFINKAGDICQAMTKGV